MLRKKIYERREFFYVLRAFFYVASPFSHPPPRQKKMLRKFFNQPDADLNHMLAEVSE